MRIYKPSEAIKRVPLLINSKLGYAKFEAIINATRELIDDLTAVAEATYAHYLEGFRIADSYANKHFPQCIYRAGRTPETMICRTIWLYNEIVKYTKAHPEYGDIWTTSRMLIAPRITHVEYQRVAKMIYEASLSRMDARMDRKPKGYNYLKDVHVAGIAEYFRFDPNEWQMPVMFKPTVVVTEDGRKGKTGRKGKGVAIFSSKHDNYLHIPKRRDPIHIITNTMTGELPFDSPTHLDGADDNTAGYLTYRNRRLYFDIIEKRYEFDMFDSHYLAKMEPRIDRMYLHDGIYAHTENGLIVPNKRIPDQYRDKCGLE